MCKDVLNIPLQNFENVRIYCFFGYQNVVGGYSPLVLVPLEGVRDQLASQLN